MKRITLIVCLLFSLCLQAGAQEIYNSSGARNARPKPQKEGGFDPQRLIFGGGLWVTFGQVTSIYVAPVVGYRFSDRFAAGTGLTYEYWRDKVYEQDYNLLAPSIWTRFLVFQNLFLQAEYQQSFMSFSWMGFDPNGSGNVVRLKDKFSVPSLLLGGGYRQPITENSSMYMMAMYDVIQDPMSPYRGIVDFRIGFNVGF
jgi:hypothetical protein